MSITEQIKTIEDAYAYLNLARSEELPFETPKNDRQQAVNAVMDAFVLVEALNEKQKPNFDDNSYKYSIWWYMRSKAAGGPGFSFSGYGFDSSYSRVSARLTFIEYDTMVYAGENFAHVFKPFMIFPE